MLISLVFALPLFLMRFFKKTGELSDPNLRYDIDDYVADEL
jgi:hypothetical protein